MKFVKILGADPQMVGLHPERGGALGSDCRELASGENRASILLPFPETSAFKVYPGHRPNRKWAWPSDVIDR